MEGRRARPKWMENTRRPVYVRTRGQVWADALRQLIKDFKHAAVYVRVKLGEEIRL